MLMESSVLSCIVGVFKCNITLVLKWRRIQKYLAKLILCSSKKNVIRGVSCERLGQREGRYPTFERAHCLPWCGCRGKSWSSLKLKNQCMPTCLESINSAMSSWGVLCCAIRLLPQTNRLRKGWWYFLWIKWHINLYIFGLMVTACTICHYYTYYNFKFIWGLNLSKNHDYLGQILDLDQLSDWVIANHFFFITKVGYIF